MVQLEIQKGAKNKWTVAKLRELFNDYVSAREKVEQQISTGISASRQPASQPLKLSAEALMVGPRSQVCQNERNKVFWSCRICDGKHWNDECMKYSATEARKQRTTVIVLFVKNMDIKQMNVHLQRDAITVVKQTIITEVCAHKILVSKRECLFGSGRSYGYNGKCTTNIR